MSDLLVLHDDNSVFSDYSKDAKDYLRDEFQVINIAVEDSLYIGLYKPFNSIYIDINTTDSLADLSFTINAASIAVDDDTKSFSRSGFMQFTKPSTWASSTINGVDAYWLKVDSTTDYDVTFNGINIVFADDNDLSQEVRNISNLKAKGDTSFIAYHVAARNEIIQSLRNGGYSKFVDDLVSNITKWDILEFGEIRQAAKYLTLAKIFFDISENVEDKFYTKFKDYEGMFGAAFKTFYLKLDQNDDGIYVQEEDLTDGSVEILRV
jgi:hypothetical protein